MSAELLPNDLDKLPNRSLQLHKSLLRVAVIPMERVVQLAAVVLRGDAGERPRLDVLDLCLHPAARERVHARPEAPGHLEHEGWWRWVAARMPSVPGESAAICDEIDVGVGPALPETLGRRFSALRGKRCAGYAFLGSDRLLGRIALRLNAGVRAPNREKGRNHRTDGGDERSGAERDGRVVDGVHPRSIADVRVSWRERRRYGR